MKRFFLLIALALPVMAFSQQPVSSFTLFNVADGTEVTLSNFSIPVVAIFISNTCAYDVSYMGRIRALVSQYEGRFQFLLINSNQDPTEADDQMVMKYKSWGINAPYLSDKNQAAMESLGAKKTPEAFLLQKNAGKFFVLYKGLIDDNAQVPSDVRQNYLRDSMEKLLAREKITVTEMRAVGCSIRRK